MKKNLFIFFIYLFLFIFFPYYFVFSQNVESIEKYEVYIKINRDSSIEVLETIDYNFDTNLKRGIYREIKTIFEEEGKTYKLNISDINITKEDDTSYFFEIKEKNNFLRIDIGGDIPKFSGIHRFNIKYKVSPAFYYKENYDKFYWNAIGGDWNVNIYNPKVIIEFPEPILAINITSECYVGFVGSDNKCSSSAFEYDLWNEKMVNKVIYENRNPVGNGKEFTINLKIPKGFIDKVEAEEVLPIPIIFYLIIIFSFIFPIIGLTKIYKKGLEKDRKKVIVRQYDTPEEVSLSDAGLILNRRFSDKELIGELISLATRGYIKIISGKKKFWIVKVPGILFLKLKETDNLSLTEKTILNSIFDKKFKITKFEAKEYLTNNKNPQLEKDIENAKEISLSTKFQNHFYKHFKEIKEVAKREVFEKGFFEKSFKKAIREKIIMGFKYFIILDLIILIVFLIVFLSFELRDFENFIFFIISMLIIHSFLFSFFIVFSVRMFPKRTDKGIEMKRHLLGLKEYISVAEKERMDFHFDPKSNPKLFEKLLPFAVVLGVDKKWTSHLKDLNYNPDWYSDTKGGAFNVSTFNVLSRSISSSSSTSSGGGGGAGGGMGGGGGGSR